MAEKEIPSKYYERFMVVRNKDAKTLLNALDLVKKYIIRERRIIVGGMSIDFALRLKGSYLYDDDAIPDYDFYSDKHFVDAYEIAQWLVRTGYDNVSVINARHPTTMRVRVNFEVVADVTYVPKAVLEVLPTLQYQGFRIIHPHFQFIDQHRALSTPFENPPMETIGGRWKKDMKRHLMLYEHYPLRMINVRAETVELRPEPERVKTGALENCIVGGFAALSYWLQEAARMGCKTEPRFGAVSCAGDTFTFTAPTDSHGLTLYTTDLDKTVRKLGGTATAYHPFLGIFTQSVRVTQNGTPAFECFDLSHDLLSAHNDAASKLHFVNLQGVMKYLLAYYIIIQKMHRQKRGYSFYAGYLAAREVIQWASSQYADRKDPTFLKFLPSPEVFGGSNQSESYLLSRERFRAQQSNQKAPQLQPKHMYSTNMPHKTIPPALLDFDPASSPLFQIDGSKK